MRIFGISLTTVILLVLVVWVTRKYGNTIPVVKEI